MRSIRLLPALMLVLVLVLVAVAPGGQSNAEGSFHAVPVPHSGVALPNSNPQQPNLPSPGRPGPALTHPCGGMFAEPPFTGLSPLAIAHVANYCSGSVYTDPYGDIYTWQASGHDYVALSGFGLRMFYLINVDDPYNPVLLYTMPFPSGGSAGTSVYAWKQGNNRYVSATMRGSGTGCGFFVYNVNDPSNPQLVGRKTGTDWCTPHEHFVSTDANGDADYAWLTMSGESGSGYKIIVLDMRNLPTMTETGRYQRSDSSGSIFTHDVNVVGERVFVAHWGGGMLIFDKDTLAHNINPTPLSPLNGIRPSGFNVHHTVPTTDGNHVFIEDEFINTAGTDKMKMYNITNISSPVYEAGIAGTGTEATNRAHNMRIKSVSAGHDLLIVGWYRAGTRIFSVDTTVTPPSIVEVASHQLRQAPDGQFGDVWGVDYLPCTVRGVQTICLYSGDLEYGLVVDALGYDPMLDPYNPTSQVTDPTSGQNISACDYTIQGTAHDYYSGASQVEVSTNNGATWSLAQGAANWTFDWTIPSDGAYTIKSRARDVAGNLEIPTASVTVNVSGGCPAVTPMLVGHVTWQGRPGQPNALQQLPITLTLKSGAIEVNYPTQNTDATGSFSVNVASLANGAYNWRVKGPKSLSNSGSVTLGGASRTDSEMGLMLTGDSNDDNVVNVGDFNIMKLTFGKSNGDPGYDDRGDLNGDQTVNITDFSLQKGNFGQNGSPPVRVSK